VFDKTVAIVYSSKKKILPIFVSISECGLMQSNGSRFYATG